MKSKAGIFLAAVMLSLSAQADEPKNVVLKDGTTAVVIATNGKLTTYLKAMNVGADGKAVLEQGEVFDGTRLAKTADGRCVEVIDRLVRMDEAVVAGGKIQLPVTKRTEESVTCGS